jgi:WbqC-like protein family
LAQSHAQTPLLTAVLPPLREIIEQPWTRLVDLDLALIRWLADQLAITTPCHRASTLNITGDRNDRLLNLCRRFGATRYLSGSAPRDSLDVERFADEGIAAEWHDYEHPRYAQLHGHFILLSRLWIC